MNHSLRTADCATHVRIVAIALIAGIVVVLTALHAQWNAPAGETSAADVIVIKAARQVVYSAGERALTH